MVITCQSGMSHSSIAMILNTKVTEAVKGSVSLKEIRQKCKKDLYQTTLNDLDFRLDMKAHSHQHHSNNGRSKNTCVMLNCFCVEFPAS